MHRSLALTAAALVLRFVAPAFAGIADSPLPELLPGTTTFHLYSVPGVTTGNGTLTTFFSCTSTDTATMQVGVELFLAGGGAPANDAVATSLSVAPGQTMVFGTGAAAWISLNSNLGFASSRGSARVVATSKKLACTAFVADNGNDPPTTSWQLTIISKLKQKAAN